jgi:hypothetical protein
MIDLLAEFTHVPPKQRKGYSPNELLQSLIRDTRTTAITTAITEAGKNKSRWHNHVFDSIDITCSIKIGSEKGGFHGEEWREQISD